MLHNPDKEFALSKIKRSYGEDSPPRSFMTFQPCTFFAYYIGRRVGDNEFAHLTSRKSAFYGRVLLYEINFDK